MSIQNQEVLLVALEIHLRTPTSFLSSSYLHTILPTAIPKSLNSCAFRDDFIFLLTYVPKRSHPSFWNRTAASPFLPSQTPMDLIHSYLLQISFPYLVSVHCKQSFVEFNRLELLLGEFMLNTFCIGQFHLFLWIKDILVLQKSHTMRRFHYIPWRRKGPWVFNLTTV